MNIKPVKMGTKTTPKKKCSTRTKVIYASTIDKVKFTLPLNMKPLQKQKELSSQKKNKKKDKSINSNANEIKKLDLRSAKGPLDRLVKMSPQKTISNSIIGVPESEVTISKPRNQTYIKMNSRRKLVVKDESTQVSESDFQSAAIIPKRKHIVSRNERNKLRKSKLEIHFAPFSDKGTSDGPSSSQLTTKSTLLPPNRPRGRPKGSFGRPKSSPQIKFATLSDKDTSSESISIQVPTKSSSLPPKQQSNVSSISVGAEGPSLPPKRPRGRPKGGCVTAKSTPKKKFAPLSDKDTSGGSSIINATGSSLPPKRPRGGPKGSSGRSKLKTASFYEETASGGSSSSRVPAEGSPLQQPKRPRGRPKGSGGRPRSWWFKDDDRCSPEPMKSEYELQRERNIEENQKKLRELFGIVDPRFDANSSARSESDKCAPRKRTYRRKPLPPPRSKSQRLERLRPINFAELLKKGGLSHW